MMSNNGRGIIGGTYNVQVAYHDGPNIYPTNFVKQTPTGAEVHIFGGQDRAEAMLCAVASSSPDLSPEEVVERTFDILTAYQIRKRQDAEEAKQRSMEN